MTGKEIKEALAREARKAWPHVARASDLPFPDYWRSVVEWLTFHAPRLGGRVTALFIEGAVVDAVTAQMKGTEPTLWIVPERVKKIWENHALPVPAKPASLTDSSNVATCGDSVRERTLISGGETASVRQQMEQGRLL